MLHEGLIGVTGEEGLHELKYSTIEKDKQVTPAKSTDGWLGITDKYWAVALVPPGKQPFQPRFAYFEDGRPRYQSDFLSRSDHRRARPVADGGDAGLRRRQGSRRRSTPTKRTCSIRQFDLLIDWGWFYFITKPMF